MSLGRSLDELAEIDADVPQSADAMVEFVRFYQALIINVDASRDM